MRFVVRTGAFLALVAAVLLVAGVIGSEIGIHVAPVSGGDDDPGQAAAPPAATPTPVAVPAPRLGSDLPEPAAGLSVTARGLRLIVPEPEVEPGQPTTVRFHLTGAKVHRVATTVVRRDARFLQQPATRYEGGGDWAVDLRIPRAGTYRLIADTDRGRRVVGADLFAPGSFTPMPLPPPGYVSAVDGLTVRMVPDGDRLRFDVARRGRPVAAQPDGPLVGVRAGDMAYATARAPGDELRFRVRYPGVGRYRLFVPFEARGSRHVAAFTTTARPS